MERGAPPAGSPGQARAKVVGAGTPLGVQALADLRFLGESSSLWKIIQRVVLKT